MERDNKFLNAFNLTNSLNTPKSGRSSASVLGSRFIEDQVDFADVILAAVTKFECPINVDVCRHSLPTLGDNTHRRPERKFKMGRALTQMVSSICSESEDTVSSLSTGGRYVKTRDLAGSVLILTAVHNFRNRLVEITMNKYRYTQIPRVLMQVLGVILPSYTKLTKFTIKDCFIDKYTIPELKNILSVTNITDVCLDSSFLPEGNYNILLHQATSLQNLSLMRCNINDEVCKQIFFTLCFHQPAENMLLTLNLSSNQITDEGAKSIGETLRSNRHLRYLNLADNLITDDGVKYIFDALKEFSLTKNEVFDSRKRYMKYLRKAICNKHAIDFENNSLHKTRKSDRKITSSMSSRSPMKTVKSKGSSKTEKRTCSFEDDCAILKSEIMDSEVVDAYEHPFHKTRIIIKDGHSYSTGNLVLSYLNLAYNYLMYPSVQKLLEVLEYQKIHRNDNFCGLIKVVIDGNNLPIHCTELNNVNVILREITRKLTRTKTAKGGF